MNVIKKSLFMFSPKSGLILEKLGVFVEDSNSQNENGEKPIASATPPLNSGLGRSVPDVKQSEYQYSDIDFGTEFETCLAEALGRNFSRGSDAGDGLEPVDHQEIM